MLLNIRVIAKQRRLLRRAMSSIISCFGLDFDYTLGPARRRDDVSLFVNVIGKLGNQLVWFLYEYIGVYLVEKFIQI